MLVCMADPLQLEIIRKGVQYWNKWRDENPLQKPDMRKADLIGLDLSTADLSGSRPGRGGPPVRKTPGR